MLTCLFFCLASQQHASVSQGRICSDKFTCCHTEMEDAHQTFYLTQSKYTDTRLTSPSADPISPGEWQDSHWSAIFFFSHWCDSTRKIPKRESNPGSSAIEADALTTRPTKVGEKVDETITGGRRCCADSHWCFTPSHTVQTARPRLLH